MGVRVSANGRSNEAEAEIVAKLVCALGSLESTADIKGRGMRPSRPENGLAFFHCAVCTLLEPLRQQLVQIAHRQPDGRARMAGSDHSRRQSYVVDTDAYSSPPRVQFDSLDPLPASPHIALCACDIHAWGVFHGELDGFLDAPNRDQWGRVQAPVG